MKKQAGFTLIELMISIGLGLIIVASALMLFLSGQRNVAVQKSATDPSEDQNFGLSYIAKNIRNANLNSPSASLNNTSQFSGIIFSKDNLSASLTGLPTNFNTKFITTNTSANKSNMRLKSGTTYSDAVNDQLVIQYRPTQTGGYDCEGNIINSSYVVERYFVRTDVNGGGSDDERSALACAASQYEASETNLETVATAGIYGSGQIIMKRVDLFRVRFLVEGKRYMTVAEYNLSATKPRILAVQLGIIARAPDKSGESSISTAQEFTLLGQTFTQKTDFPNRYLRVPIMQTVALRNALGDRS